jgi:hypothetical protein
METRYSSETQVDFQRANGNLSQKIEIYIISAVCSNADIVIHPVFPSVAQSVMDRDWTVGVLFAAGTLGMYLFFTMLNVTLGMSLLRFEPGTTRTLVLILECPQFVSSALFPLTERGLCDLWQQMK